MLGKDDKALPEEAIRRFGRSHVDLFAMIVLFCHARIEAVVEIEAGKIPSMPWAYPDGRAPLR